MTHRNAPAFPKTISITLPEVSEDEKNCDWKISTPYLNKIQDFIEYNKMTDVSWEQIESVLIAVAALAESEQE